MFLQMLSKFCGTLERFVTFCADKNPPSTVLLLMKLQFCWVAKILAAAHAVVGFLFTMYELVTNKTGSHGKCHATFCALMGPHSAVNGFMLGQVGGLCETLGAHRADKRTHPSVDFLVLCHAAGQGKPLLTVGAGEGSFSQVLTLVALQSKGFIEGLAAVRAWEGLVIGVHVPLMLPQV